jgi:hydroxymethylpyrimidine pyrophosphatase-like HAD family hydrolase
VRDHRPRVRPDAAFPIRLLALDIDGTLVDSDAELSPRTIAAVREAVDRGVRVSLATGRMPSSAVVFANRLGLEEPVVGHQGAVVRAMPGPSARTDVTAPPFLGRVGRILSHQPLPPDVAAEAIRFCFEHGLDPHLNHLERMIVQAGDPNFADYSTYLGRDAETVEDLARDVRIPVSKVIAVGEEGRPMALIAEARRQFAGRASPTVSHPRFLEFVADGVSKGAAVAWLAHRARIPLGQVLAIGDALNDLEMVGDAGHGAAMPTAPAEVRLAARYIAPPVGEDGAAQLIEALVLAPPDEAARNAARLAEEAREVRAQLRDGRLDATAWGSAAMPGDPEPLAPETAR